MDKLTESGVELLRRHSEPMTPIPTEVTPQLDRLAGVRAVLFDVYGTLFISASGDVGTVAQAPADSFADACRAVGLELEVPGEFGVKTLVSAIESSHRAARERGVEYPEIDVVAIWRSTINELATERKLAGAVQDVDFQVLAMEYEVRVNPAWPMPAAKECLERLQRAGLYLGIVSNAQFFTPFLFPALLGRSLDEAGFRAELCILSYRYGQAKPGRFLFDEARKSLARVGVTAGEVLYIGNDLLNDIMPAQQVGYRTALFAGDRRSLRMRDGDRRVAGVAPDAVVTHWTQLDTVIDL